MPWKFSSDSKIFLLVYEFFQQVVYIRIRIQCLPYKLVLSRTEKIKCYSYCNTWYLEIENYYWLIQFNAV